ncbi:hypothetical protein BLNAU_1990 [Blattamonas nauphoetae]|uniref:Uncharacterized protein n=1 Tax=Blattamonas nauphoetae TaxID=2049346 RepID=A0ABQ9YGT1_9EUKA|nr:hypothetical protein BLNAU_1990 [Blattamonas nauphoetae]
MRLHVFVAIPLIVSLFLLTCPAEAIPDASFLDMKPLLEDLTETQSSNIEGRNEPIHLHGQYHVLDYVMRSLNISIFGAQSSSIVSSRTENDQGLSNSNPTSMLIVSNSTLELSSLRLICSGDHTSVATISESSLSVSNCKIHAASNTSPFLSTWTPSDNSILLVVDTQVNWKHATSLPLFGTMPSNHKSLVTESSETSILGRDTDQARGLLSIVGSGLSFSNTAFPLATGPLFDFGFDTDNTQQSLLAASVCLTRSEMTNVTSRRRLISDTVRFPLVSQRVICSSISESTNHLCGTGSLDLNFGSALCCLNSSFSKCQTDPDPTEGPPTVYLQHRTTHFDHTLSPECTLLDTCTFRDIHADRGGAIDSLEAGTSLSVTECFFLRCSADRMAGSIFFWQSPSCSIALSHSSFVSGNSGAQAGAVQFSYCSLGSITDCVFYDLNTTGSAGAMMMKDCPGPITVSNCLFQKCRHLGGGGLGGAIHSVNSGFTFKSLRFRENLAVSHHRGHDLAIELTEATRDASSFEDCDTDQEDIQIFFINFAITPNLITASTPLAVSSVNSVGSSNNRTAQATISLDQPISGTVLVLVDNTGNYEMPNDDSPPPITRMISFDFSADSTSAECELSFGEWEVLQYEANYSLVTFGWKESIVDTNGAVLTTPNPPRVVRAVCEGGNSEFDAFFSLKARTLATGSYKASVKGKSDFWMVVDFLHDPSGGTLSSTEFGLKLQGEDAILDFETTYEIDEVIDESTRDALILDPPRLFFTTPSRPVLKSVGTITFSDSKQDVINIKLVGETLFANPYTLTVTDGSATSTLTAVFDADGVNGETTAVLYSMDGSSTVQLGFGKTYTITGFTCSASNQPTLTPNLKILVPSEPPRVEKVISAALNDAQNEVEVTFQARALPATITSVTITGKDASIFVSAQRLSDTSFSARFHVAEVASFNSLIFDETYSIESVSNGTNFILNDDLSFAVPHNSFISSAIFSFVDVHHTRCQISFEGTRLPTLEEYTVLLSPSFSFRLSFPSPSLGQSPTLSIGLSDTLQYAQTYSIVSITKTSNPTEHLRFDASIEIETGPKPTWTSITVNEGGSNKTEECGSVEEPCGSVAWGWKAGKAQLGGNRVRISIKKEVGFGERIRVGSERLVIQSATRNRSRLLCNSSVFETSAVANRKAGIVSIDGGLVGLSSLVLSLHSASSAEVVRHFVVFGKGLLVVESVEIITEGSGVVGMGVGWMKGGEMKVNSVLMKNVVLGVTLFGGEDKHEGIDFSVCELNVCNCTTSDALVHFSSLLPSSSYSLSHSSFHTTIRTIDSTSSSSATADLSLISITCCQELISVVDCVFEKSGTCLSSSPSTFTGSILHITLSSLFRSQSTVEISSCLFVDCLSVLSGTGTLYISTGTHSTRIDRPLRLISSISAFSISKNN